VRILQTQLTAAGRAAVTRAERATRALEAEMFGDGADPAEAAQVVAAMGRWSETLAAPRGART
jgi:DNA-binding MarR family transcriptional regulator